MNNISTGEQISFQPITDQKPIIPMLILPISTMLSICSGKFSEYINNFCNYSFKLRSPTQRVIFLAASDEPKWIEENLIPKEDIYFTDHLFGNIYFQLIVLAPAEASVCGCLC